MVRRSILAIACVLALAGCDERSEPAGLMAGRGQDLADGRPASGETTVAPAPQQFSYSHAWNVRMAHGAVSPRFVRARDLCLKDRALACRLVSANISSGEDNGYTSASLEVQLPHAKLDVFEKTLLAPVAGEKAGDAAMESRSTQAQSVETEATDTARKVAQLTAYRDRLADIARRTNLSVDDIIKLEAERARVQGDLDDAAAHERDLTNGIARESVSIQLTERVQPVGPLTLAFRSAGDTLAESTASALRFTIAAVPWLPVVAAGIFLLSFLWRLFRRRQKAIVAPG
jgi:hypothetical protein